MGFGFSCLMFAKNIKQKLSKIITSKWDNYKHLQDCGGKRCEFYFFMCAFFVQMGF